MVVSVVHELLKDPRVDVTLPDHRGCTPFWWASYEGHRRIIEWLIASGRELGDVANVKGKWNDQEYTALETARTRKRVNVVSVLEMFMANPTQTRHEVRVKFGFPDQVAAEVFALIVFLCDGVLQLKPALISSRPPGLRFFAIACKLPIELQMVLCHRVFESMKQSIVRNNSEIAFQSLARILRASHPE